MLKVAKMQPDNSGGIFPPKAHLGKYLKNKCSSTTILQIFPKIILKFQISVSTYERPRRQFCELTPKHNWVREPIALPLSLI